MILGCPKQKITKHSHNWLWCKGRPSYVTDQVHVHWLNGMEHEMVTQSSLFAAVEGSCSLKMFYSSTDLCTRFIRSVLLAINS